MLHLSWSDLLLQQNRQPEIRGALFGRTRWGAASLRLPNAGAARSDGDLGPQAISLDRRIGVASDAPQITLHWCPCMAVWEKSLNVSALIS